MAPTIRASVLKAVGGHREPWPEMQSQRHRPAEWPVLTAAIAARAMPRASHSHCKVDL